MLILTLYQVYGWGSTYSGAMGGSPKLLEVSVLVVNSTQCATSMGPMMDGQICAGGEAGKDACQVTKEQSGRIIRRDKTSPS